MSLPPVSSHSNVNKCAYEYGAYFIYEYGAYFIYEYFIELYFLLKKLHILLIPSPIIRVIAFKYKISSKLNKKYLKIDRHCL